MRKHPLLAFAVTTLGLSLGASLYGAVGAAATPRTTQQEKKITSDSHAHRTVTRQVNRPRAGLPHLVAVRATTPVRFFLPSSVISLPAAAGLASGGVWALLRSCESSNNYRDDSGNGFYGAYQFTQNSWQLVGGIGRPDLATPAAQDDAAKRLLARQGWRAWPHCTWALGLD